MLDHIGFRVADFEASMAFYKRALAPLGVVLMVEIPRAQTGAEAHAGFGAQGRAFFWIATGPKPKGGAHIALTAASRAEVDAFHAAALAAGGRDNGAPGLRPHYDPHYYGAFVLDPDGNNIEAVHRGPSDL